MKKRIVKVFRFNPLQDKEPKYKTYEMGPKEGVTILEILQHIYENIDSSLGYYCSCRIGKCNGCLVVMNGKTVRACTTLAPKEMIIEPLRGYEIVKDLVVNLGKRITKD